MRSISPLDYHEIQLGPELAEAFVGTGYLHAYSYRNVLTGTMETVVFGSLFLVLLLSVSALLFRRSRRQALPAGVLLAVGVFLMSGIYGPISGAWETLYVSVPFARVFREVYHYGFVVVIATATLLSHAIDALMQRVDHPAIGWAITIAILIVVSSAGSPLLSGSFLGQVQVYDYSDDQRAVLEDLENDPSTARVLYLPSINPIHYPETSYPGRDPMIEHSPQPTFPASTWTSSRLGPYHRYVLQNLRREDGSDISPHLAAVSTDRVVLRRSMTGTLPWISDIDQSEWQADLEGELRGDDGLRMARQRGDVLVYRVQDPQPFVATSPGVIFTYGDMDVLRALPRSASAPVVFLPEGDLDAERIEDHAQVITTDGSFDPRFVTDDRSIHLRFDLSNSDPSDGWAHPELSWWADESARSFPPYYAEGMIETNAVTSADVDVSDEPVLRRWTFDESGDAAEWRNATPERQFDLTQELTAADGRLEATIPESTWGWKTIRSPSIPASNGTSYHVSARIRKENAECPHVKIAELNASGSVLRTEPLGGDVQCLTGEDAGEPADRWHTIEETYRPQSPDASAIQVQVWHGHEADPPFPNRVLVDEVTVRNVSLDAHPIERTTFDVPESGEYRIIGHVRTGPENGTLGIRIDGESLLVRTGGTNPQFTWREVGTVKLDAGEHTFEVANVDGTNAITDFVLVPTSNGRSERLPSSPGETPVAAFFTEPTDFDRRGPVEVRNGTLDLGDGGRIRRPVEILEDGRYKLVVDGDGPLSVALGDEEFRVDGESRRHELGAVHLERGVHELVIAPQNGSGASVDGVVVHSAPDNQSLRALFDRRDRNAEVLDYEKITPTKYEVRVNASAPYMLSFAQGHDSLWVAEVRTNGGVKQYEPVPLYGATNGFWIDETGEHTVTIRYRPQRWFYYGAGLSGGTVILSVGYLVYALRRRRATRSARAT